jgi:hypothetical protein
MAYNGKIFNTMRGNLGISLPVRMAGLKTGWIKFSART